MSIDGYFDDAALLAMCLAFDRTADRFRACGVATRVQEVIAIRIVEVAIQGERDADRLHDEAVKALDI